MDYTKQLGLDFGSIESVEDLCKNWPAIRTLLQVAQLLLQIPCPPAAAAIGVIIALFDKVCPKKTGSGTTAGGLREAQAKMIAALRTSAAPTNVQGSPCQTQCKERYERELANCGDDLECISGAFGRYVICMLNCNQT